MRASSVIVMAIVAFAMTMIASVAANTAAPVPFMAWSTSNTFLSQHAHMADATDQDVDCLMYSLFKTRHSCQSTQLKQFVQFSFQTPEVVVAFVFRKMGSEDFSRVAGAYTHSNSLHQLKEALHTAESSLMVEYLFPTDAAKFSERLAHLAASGARRAQTIVFKPEALGQHHVNVDSILSHLESESHIFSNGVTDLILIELNQAHNMERKDAMIHRITSKLFQHTNGNAVAILTADAASHEIEMEFNGQPRHRHNSVSAVELMGTVYTASNSSSNGTSDYTGPQYVTSNIILGLLLGAFLIFTLVVGINVVTSIEPPVRFPKRVLLVKKEY